MFAPPINTCQGIRHPISHVDRSSFCGGLPSLPGIRHPISHVDTVLLLAFLFVQHGKQRGHADRSDGSRFVYTFGELFYAVCQWLGWVTFPSTGTIRAFKKTIIKVSVTWLGKWQNATM